MSGAGGGGGGDISKLKHTVCMFFGVGAPVGGTENLWGHVPPRPPVATPLAGRCHPGKGIGTEWNWLKGDDAALRLRYIDLHIVFREGAYKSKFSMYLFKQN